jgi:hypothetical protein
MEFAGWEEEVRLEGSDRTARTERAEIAQQANFLPVQVESFVVTAVRAPKLC